MISDAEHGIPIRFEIRQRELIAVVGQKRRQEPRTLLPRHQPVEQQVGKHRGLRQHGRDVGIAQRQFLGHDGGGERVGAGAAGILGQRKRAQPELRGLVEHVDEQRSGPRLEALRP
jgi:hypothetical protein